MHLHFERIEKPNSFLDSSIFSLSWMGKVPDGLLQSEKEDGWKLNRTNYYQDGWIAIGNRRGIVGVTYTSCKCRKANLIDLPQRTNFNLRGHRSQVTLVKWNEPYQKLASCDASGMIFVWIKYEGRWSVELINDRNIQVTDFSWSHDGRMALICYIDGFVLIGSVAGQRYWSSMLNLESCFITCGVWTPDDQQVIFGTSNGNLLVIDINGAFVAQVVIREDHSISSMSWSVEKFKMEDNDDDLNLIDSHSKSYVLAISFEDGVFYLIKNYDDIFPIIIKTNLLSIQIEWSNKGEILAVGGHQIQNESPSLVSYINKIHLYTNRGILRYAVIINYTLSPITALTWGHNDKRLFVGTGSVLHTAWVTKKIPTLQLLSRLVIYCYLSNEQDVKSLQLPLTLQTFVSNLFGRTLRCYLPDIKNLIKFVIQPPRDSTRLYCTLIRHDDPLISGFSSYILYLEYLGGLLPILKGKRTSKVRPEFVIFDPQIKQNSQLKSLDTRLSSNSQASLYWYSPSNPGTESETDNTLTPRLRRKRRFRRHRSRGRNSDNQNDTTNVNINEQLKPEKSYLDEMSEDDRLILITSNIWGTKFKILGLVPWLPSHLGSVAYRTSLLHLQPRQMTLRIKELGKPRNNLYSESFMSNQIESNAYISSDDDDDEEAKYNPIDSSDIPIAPMTPKKVASHQAQLSPEKQTVYLSSSAISDRRYSNYFTNLGDEMLTLQINNDSNGIKQYMTIEMTHSAPRLIQKTSNSVSTQTSFQSFNNLFSELIANETKFVENPEVLIENESRSVEGQKLNIKSTFNAELKIENEPKLVVNSNNFEKIPEKNKLKQLQVEITNEDESCIQNFSNKLPKSDLPCSSKTETEQSVMRKILQSSVALSTIPTKITRLANPVNFSVNNSLLKNSSEIQKNHLKLNTIESDQYNHSKSCDYKLNFLKVEANSSKQNTHYSCVATKSNCVDQNLASSSTRSKPVHSSITIHDLKSINQSELEKNYLISNSIEKSPSLLIYKNCSSITQFLSKNDSNCKSNFTNVRATQENLNLKQERRFTLSKSKSIHSVINENTVLNSKERIPNCMSLDKDEDEEINDELQELTSLESSCKCNQELNNYEKETLNLESVKIPKDDKIQAHNMLSPIHLPRKKLLNFDCKKVFKSLTENNSLLKPQNYPTHDPPSSIQNSKVDYCKNHALQSIIDDDLTTQNEVNRSLSCSPSLTRTRRKADGRRLFYSPTMFRKVMKQKLHYLDCSSEDDNSSDDEYCSSDFKDREEFEKAYFKKKNKVRRKGSRIQPDKILNNQYVNSCREFLLHNKAPLWNEINQVYQLDFGGRVTQESAKNFQIEHQSKQVMQFGRIDDNAYTLDFQYPFSALQALAVALANITQRLK